MSDECRETYKECTAARRARVEAVIAAAEPWETQAELAEKAGVNLRTVKRALHDGTPVPFCNSEPEAEIPYETQQVVWFLKKQQTSVRVVSDGVFVWYTQLSPISRRRILKRLQQFDANGAENVKHDQDNEEPAPLLSASG